MVYSPSLGLIMITFLIAAFSTWPLTKAACYYPSGRLAPNDTPCRDDTPNAACCGQGYACLTNGICQATGAELEKPGATEFVRGSCTDKEWRSSRCPLFCIEDGADFLDGGNGIFKCENTTEDLYFCINKQSGTEASCEEKENVLFFPGTPSAITTIGLSPRTTSSLTSTTTSSISLPSTSVLVSSTAQDPSTSASPRASENTTGPETQVPANDTAKTTAASSNLGPIIGGVLGATAAVFLAGAGGWFLARKRKQNSKDNGAELPTMLSPRTSGQGEPKFASGSSQTSTGLCEAPAPSVYWDQKVQRGPSELPHATEIPWGPAPAELPAELPGGCR
ncbi:hypothetical protein C8A03DRAFT_29500 [Achaetomium macrosporum]|uniref:Uncharacterized protein n=1 Tax=Achaetomium macrosporum TaxID=79813 RepID=A0AAN7HJ25_9PEZI|nr:hypothetical protein C8A03DRAFT_29500 [Achaetomium macrosporum]